MNEIFIELEYTAGRCHKGRKGISMNMICDNERVSSKERLGMILQYYDLASMLSLIDESNRSACWQLWGDNSELFRQAPGSNHNHQAWTGGYQDHITEAMNL